MIRQNAPKTGAAFAMWGFAFSMCDCTLIAIRSKLKFFFSKFKLTLANKLHYFFSEKEDIFNSITAGAATGGILAARQGFAVASVSAGIGGLLLGLIEGGSLLMNRMGTEMLRPMAPPTQNAPQAFD